MAGKKSNGGCLRTIWRGFLWVIGIIFGIAILGSIFNRNDTPTQQPTPVLIVVTATPTSAPPTDTPVSNVQPNTQVETIEVLPALAQRAVSVGAVQPLDNEMEAGAEATVGVATRIAIARVTAAVATERAAPTNTPVPPTATLVPAATPIPPTSTPIPATPTLTTIDLSAAADELVVVTWNVGLDDASIDTIAAGIQSMPGVDIWLIQEARGNGTAQALERAAEAARGDDYTAVLGSTGADIPLLTMYNEHRFDLLGTEEIHNVNTTGNARAPLVLHLKDSVTGVEFLAMNNHLYRSREDERDKQAALLNQWALGQTLPIIDGGDHNFDYDVPDGPSAADRGFDNMTAGGTWQWVRPAVLVPTQCTDSLPCTYDDILDFIFVAGPARDWTAVSEVIVRQGDIPDNALKSDHRPVVAIFVPEIPRRVVEVQPEAFLTAIATATRVVVAIVPRVNSSANLRSGPGTNYAVSGSASAGQELGVVGTNGAGDWPLLNNGLWIASFLVDDAPARSSLPVAAAPPPPATATPQPAPTAVPTPVPVVVVQPPPQRVEPVQAGNCLPNYPDVCIPPGRDLDCGEIPYRRFRVVGGDPFRFDGDNDGIGCES